MPPNPKSSTKAILMLIASCFQILNSAHAQDFTTLVGESIPFSLGGPASNDDPSLFGWNLGLTDGLKGGFNYDIGASSIYDSNFRLQEDDPESELITVLTPRIAYTTDPEGGAPLSINATYTPVYRTYLDNSDLSGFDQSGQISIRTTGAKTSITASARYSEVSGTDRITRSFVTGSLINFGLSGTYQIMPRTLLSASGTIAMSDYSGSSAVGSDIYSMRVGALWAASERLSFGPSIRYIYTEADTTGAIEAWAAFIELQYRAGERIKIIAALGLEMIDTSCLCPNGVTGSLSASYMISDRWFWRNSIRYVTIPSPTETDYVINNLGLSTMLTRELLRATVGIGMDYNASDYEQLDEQSDLPTENNLGVFISYNRQLFTERLDFDSKLRYSTNEGGSDWSQLQLSIGLRLKF